MPRGQSRPHKSGEASGIPPGGAQGCPQEWTNPVTGSGTYRRSRDSARPAAGHAPMVVPAGNATPMVVAAPAPAVAVAHLAVANDRAPYGAIALSNNGPAHGPVAVTAAHHGAVYGTSIGRGDGGGVPLHGLCGGGKAERERQQGCGYGECLLHRECPFTHGVGQARARTGSQSTYRPENTGKCRVVANLPIFNVPVLPRLRRRVSVPTGPRSLRVRR